MFPRVRHRFKGRKKRPKRRRKKRENGGKGLGKRIKEKENKNHPSTNFGLKRNSLPASIRDPSLSFTQCLH